MSDSGLESARDEISRPEAGLVGGWSAASGRGRAGIRRGQPQHSLRRVDHRARR